MPHTNRGLCTQCGFLTPLACEECGPGHAHGVVPSPCFEALEAVLTGAAESAEEFDCRTCALRFKANPRVDPGFPMSMPPQDPPDAEDQVA